MKNYVRRSKEIIRDEGIKTFSKKFLKNIRTNFDKFITKLFSKHYIKGFHKLYYYSPNTMPKTYWFDVLTTKCPLDMWIYQEIIYKLKPEIILECGTAHGGSALYFASLLDLIGKGKVITIDINKCNVNHKRIIKLIGSSTSEKIVDNVKKLIGNKKALVILDSNHKKDHVLKELEIYSKFVPIRGYIVVEDTNINNHPVFPGWGPGPMEAVKEFLKKEKNFKIDKDKEKFMLTFFPKGFLKRIK